MKNNVELSFSCTLKYVQKVKVTANLGWRKYLLNVTWEGSKHTPRYQYLQAQNLQSLYNKCNLNT